jgi:hypothetical protein
MMSNSDELTEVCESIARQLAEARKQRLMGNIDKGVKLYHHALNAWARSQDALATLPGFYALEHAVTVTTAMMAMAMSQEQPKPRAPRLRRFRPVKEKNNVRF